MSQGKRGKTPASKPGGSGRGLHVRVKTARGRKVGSQIWLQRQLNDPYVVRAKTEGYRSRAAFKLIELDDKYHFLARGKKVVDLGAAPGGWTQIAVDRVKAGAPNGGAVVGIDIDAEPERVRADVARYACGAAGLLGLEFDPATLEVVAGHAGPAYGVPHAATLEALHLAARQEALVLDPVYSAKGLAGLIALLQAGRWGAGEDVVFVHTGGAPSVFAHLQ